MDVKLQLFQTGYCVQAQHMVLKGGKWKKVRFYATFALIQHPKKGVILFDTGYSLRFHQATAAFPGSVYAKLTPVFTDASQSAVNILKNIGISRHQVSHVILSHFHADHIGGVIDFNQAVFHCMKQEFWHLKNKNPLAALLKGFLPELLPADFESRTAYIDQMTPVALAPEFSPFKWGYDLFSDKSVIAVSLPGHTLSHFGILVKTRGTPHFLVSDACWDSQNYTHLRYPSRATALIKENTRKYKQTLNNINELYHNNKNLVILSCHCPTTLKRVRNYNPGLKNSA